MKTTHILIVLIIPFFSLSMTCNKEKKNTDDCHYRIEFQNNSDKNLAVVLSYDYPDTSINFQYPLVDSYSFTGFISPNQSDYVRSADRCVESILQDFSYQKVSLFIFDEDIFRNIPWSQIRQNYQVLKRYDFTLDELRALKWHVDFDL